MNVKGVKLCSVNKCYTNTVRRVDLVLLSCFPQGRRGHYNEETDFWNLYWLLGLILYHPAACGGLISLSLCLSVEKVVNHTCCNE